VGGYLRHVQASKSACSLQGLRHVCRYCKHDGQLVKKVQQLLDGAVDYFKWAAVHPSSHFALASLALQAFFAFVDTIGCFFAPVGVPGKLITGILRVAKGFAAVERERAAAAVPWRAGSLQNSAAMWRDIRPALRVALESASAGGAGAAGGEGRRKRARL
jgi:hypothetical protein